MDADLDIATESRLRHRTIDGGYPLGNGQYDWRYRCSVACGWESSPFDPRDCRSGASARREAARHEAEMVVEAIRLGAPEAPVAGGGSLDDAPAEPVPATVEVS